MFVTFDTDLWLPSAAGAPLAVGRSYLSGAPSDGPFGIGWSSSAMPRLFHATYLYSAPSTYQKEATITMPNGLRLRFVENAGGTTYTAPSGRYDVLIRNGDGTFDLTLQRSRERFRFANDGRALSFTDENGNTTNVGYDGSLRPSQLADGAGSGRFVNIFYGANGRVSSLQDSTGRQVQYTYDSAGLLTRVTGPGSRIVNYAYVTTSIGSALSQISDANGRVVASVTYDPNARAEVIINEEGTYRYIYGAGNPYRTVKQIVGLDQRWMYTHNEGWLITDRTRIYGSVDGWGPNVHTDFRPDGSPEQVIDETGIKTFYTYDSVGHVTSVTRDYQGTQALRFDYVYDAAFPDRVASITPRDPGAGQINRDWQAWRYDYHPAGSPSPGSLFHVYRIKSDASEEVVATYLYDTRGRVTRSTTASGATTDYEYDASGNLFRVTAPANNGAGTRPVTVYGYDGAGRVTSVTDPLGKVTSYTYDALNRVLTVTLPKPSVSSTLTFTTSYSYDNYDAPTGLTFTRVTDPNGLVTQQGYDQWGRLVKSIDALSRTIDYTYTAGVLSSIRDANGNVTSYVYDPLTKAVTQVWFPDGTYEEFNYYDDGQLNMYFSRTAWRQHFYDRLKRISRRQTAAGHFEYLYQGQKLALVEEWSGPTPQLQTLTYDTTYRLQSSTQVDRGTVNYTYAAGDLVATMAVQGGPTATYGYHADGSLNTISWTPVAGQFRYNYTLAGQYQRITFPNGGTRNFGYDDQGRLLSLTNLDPVAGNLASYSYAYDLNHATGTYNRLGQRVSMTATVPAQGLNNHLTKYEYDSLYQLTKATYPNVAPFNGEVHSWTYDGIGNRLTNTVNASTKTYSYLKIGANPNNWQRLLSDGVDTYSYAYSSANPISKSGPSGTFNFIWNPFDGIERISGTLTAHYLYDYQGRRVSKTVGAATNSYLYDGLNLIREIGATPADYLFGPGIDEPLAMSRSGQTYYYATDALGSVNLVTNSGGTVQNKYLHDAWGVLRSQTGTLGNPFGYTAREFAEAGTLFYRARYYSPGIGRFLSEDPIDSYYIDRGSRPIATAKDQLYVYAGNSPAKWVDASGLDAGPKDGPCEYYSRKCAETGCGYYCEQAPKYCENPPINNRVFDNPRILECIRGGLQRSDQDILRNGPPSCMCNCPGKERCITAACITSYHQETFRACGSRTWFPGHGGTFTFVIDNCE